MVLKRCGYLELLGSLMVGNLGTISTGWNPTYSSSRNIPFQSAFLLRSSRFQIGYSLRNIISARFMSVRWDRGEWKTILISSLHFDHGRIGGRGSILRQRRSISG